MAFAARKARSGAGSQEAWLALGPAFSFRPLSALVVLDGANRVEAIADELDPPWAARNLTQATPAQRPDWLATSSAPSARPSMRGDGLQKFLSGAHPASATFGASPYTLYALHVVTATAGTKTTAGSGGSASTGRARFVPGAANARGQHGGTTLNGGAIVTPTTIWSELRYDGVTARFEDSAGGSASAALGATTVDLLAVFARISLGATSQFDDGELLWFLGYERELSATERVAVRRDLASWGGI